ncbi:hypothetical protein FRC17_002427 [Serendipita sp. 399]|nr:hypothetical protein FRC17_002427 [Serendipita sp. 399]
MAHFLSGWRRTYIKHRATKLLDSIMNFPKDFKKFSFSRPDPNKTVNRVPSSIETSLLTELVSSRRRYLEAIDYEIVATDKIASELATEVSSLEENLEEKRSMLMLVNKALEASRQNRDKILRDIMTLSNIIPVARRLPDEVLLRVFEETVETEESERRALSLEWRSYSLGKAPLVICGVCKRWRNIALGTPTLFKYVNIVSAHGNQSKPAATLAWWLNHTDPKTMQISMDGWKVQHESPLPAELTTDRFHRRPILPRVEVSCIPSTTVGTQRWDDTYPLAKEVVLISDGIDGLPTYFEPLAMEAEKVTVSGIRVWWTETTWLSLTELKVAGLASSRLRSLKAVDFREIIIMAPNLRLLDIMWDEERSQAGEDASSTTIIVHGALQTLICSFTAITSYLIPLQGSITCPTMNHLSLKTLPFIQPSELSGWLSFFSTLSPFPLRTIELPPIQRDNVNPLIILFKPLRLLEHIDLRGPSVCELIERLVIKEEERSPSFILPSLKSLDIRDSNITDNVLLQFVESRNLANRPGLARITSIRLQECPRVGYAKWEKILEMMQD